MAFQFFLPARGKSMKISVYVTTRDGFFARGKTTEHQLGEVPNGSHVYFLNLHMDGSTIRVRIYMGKEDGEGAELSGEVKVHPRNVESIGIHAGESVIFSAGF